MQPFFDLPAARPLCLFSVLLVIKIAAVAVATANARRKSGVVLNPEDTGVNPGTHAEAQEAPTTLRAKRAHLNDLENIPFFMILSVIFTLAGGSANAGWSYFTVYFVARTLHTIFYLNSAQPWRTAAFALGQIAQLGLMVQILMKAF
jgi:glutathione S-transferase